MTPAPHPLLVDATKIRTWLFERAQMHQDRNEWSSSFEDLYLVTALFRGDFKCDNPTTSAEQVLDSFFGRLENAVMGMGRIPVVTWADIDCLYGEFKDELRAQRGREPG